MRECRHIVFATPVYWYAMSGLMKVFFDRFTNLITRNKADERSLAGKHTWLIATGTDLQLPDGFEMPFSLTSRYFSMKFEGSVYAQFDATGALINADGDGKTRLLSGLRDGAK